jgi:hypothetical protein
VRVFEHGCEKSSVREFEHGCEKNKTLNGRSEAKTIAMQKRAEKVLSESMQHAKVGSQRPYCAVEDDSDRVFPLEYTSKNWCVCVWV